MPGHGEHEERQPGEVPGLAGIVLHVGEREQVHQKAPIAGDDDHHAAGSGRR